MKTHVMLLALLSSLVSGGCSLSHVTVDRPRDPPGDPIPDAGLAPDAGAPDAGAPDTGAPDAGAPLDAGPLRDCVPPLVADAELCVGWRVVAAPPCEVLALVRVAGRLGVECGTATYVLRDDAWWLAPAPGQPISAPTITSRPDTVFADALILAELPDGSVVAPHGDVYAHPAAWRADRDGLWRETLPPPSAFVLFGAALSDDEALFVGRDAYVFVRARR